MAALAAVECVCPCLGRGELWVWLRSPQFAALRAASAGHKYLWFTSDELLGAFSGSTGFTEISFSLPRMRWNNKQKVHKLSRWHQKLRSEPTIIEFVWDLFLMSRKLLLCVSGLEDEVKLQPHLLFCLHLHLCCWSRTLWLLCIVVVLQRCKKCFSAANFHCQWHKIESRPA